MKYATLILCLWLSLPALAQPLISRQQLFQEQDIAEVNLATDGQRLYYRRRSVGEPVLFYRSLQRPMREERIPLSGALLDWVPVAGGILTVETDGRRPQLLFRPRSGAVQPTGLFPLRQIRILATSPQRPQEAAVEIAGDTRSGVFRVNFHTGSWEPISPPLPYQELFFDGQLRLAAARQFNEQGGISLFRYDGTSWVEACRYPFDERQFLGGFQNILSVSADGETVYLLDSEGSDKTVLTALDRRSGATRLLLADGKADLLPDEYLAGPNGQPLMVQSHYGAPRRHFPDTSAQADFEWANRLLQGQAHFYESSADGRYWLLSKQAGTPPVYYLFDRLERQMIRMLTTLPALHNYRWAERHAESYLSPDGCEWPVQVYLPPGADTDGDGRPERPLPTLLFVHGGPWLGVLHWEDWAHTRHFQLLANRGYAVVVPEFRGTTGLGQWASDYGAQQWGQAMHEDKMAAVGWATEQGIADPGRIGIWGWSYGGYASAMALALSPERFACGMALYGPMDLLDFSRTPFAANRFWTEQVGDAQTAEGAEQLRRYSPARRAGAIRKPLLLSIGGRDGRIPRRQMESLAETLYQQGKPVVYLYFPGEVHDYEQPGSWTAFWAQAERFLHRYLGGRYEDLGESPNATMDIRYGKDLLQTVD